MNKINKFNKLKNGKIEKKMEKIKFFNCEFFFTN